MLTYILAAILSIAATSDATPERCGWEATPCVMECLDMCTGIAGCLDVCVPATCGSEAIPVACGQE